MIHLDFVATVCWIIHAHEKDSPIRSVIFRLIYDSVRSMAHDSQVLDKHDINVLILITYETYSQCSVVMLFANAWKDSQRKRRKNVN